MGDKLIILGKYWYMGNSVNMGENSSTPLSQLEYIFPYLISKYCLLISVDGMFEEWSHWYSCDVTCGGGLQWRNRTCNGPFHGGAPCQGDFTESKICNTDHCPSKYLVRCSGGLQWHNRTCNGPFHGGAPCQGDFTESKICNTDHCPSKCLVNCVWWGPPVVQQDLQWTIPWGCSMPGGLHRVQNMQHR